MKIEKLSDYLIDLTLLKFVDQLRFKQQSDEKNNLVNNYSDK